MSSGNDTPERAAPLRGDKLDRLETDLQKVPGVRSARVIGMGSPSEIHIVATSDRPPKQVVRDVQSLASAGFGITIDHRIVSVVQLDDAEEASSNGAQAPVPDGARPVLDKVVFASKGVGGWVKVGLTWPDGESTEGAASIGLTRESRARGAAAAAVRALEPVLAPTGSALDVDHVVLQQLGSDLSVTVHALYHDKGAAVPLVGSALIHDDVASAAARAVLQAVNRKLR
ncbi:MAG TPA: hypothetical protein VHJ34_10405 [Actinomycetota bacterium]|nr:hypothetical protein [Actinomycetota bacterium]